MHNNTDIHHSNELMEDNITDLSPSASTNGNNHQQQQHLIITLPNRTTQHTEMNTSGNILDNTIGGSTNTSIVPSASATPGNTAITTSGVGSSSSGVGKNYLLGELGAKFLLEALSVSTQPGKVIDEFREANGLKFQQDM